MTTPGHGIEYLDVRNMWKDEAIDFTPWLADHLDMLNDAAWSYDGYHDWEFLEGR